MASNKQGDGKARIQRTTKETSIDLNLAIRGKGTAEVKTGIGFLDHMLDLFAFHGGFDLKVKAEGDLQIDAHHTAEDIGICLGMAFLEALGDKKGIARYAHCYLPMDESLTRTVVDISGRAHHVFRGTFASPMVGALPTEIIPHFFGSFASNSRITLHQEILYGDGDHHKAESLFKGLGRSLREACRLVELGRISSTKGLL